MFHIIHRWLLIDLIATVCGFKKVSDYSVVIMKEAYECIELQVFVAAMLYSQMIIPL